MPLMKRCSIERFNGLTLELGILVALLLLGACQRPEPAAVTSATPSAAQSTIWKVNSLKGAWRYADGSSPQLPNGDLLWAQPDFDDTSWQLAAVSGLAPVQRSSHELWARILVSGPALSSPILILRANSDISEAYLQGRRLPLEEVPFHAWDKKFKFGRDLIIPLRANYSGQVLSIHLQSSDRMIGLQPLTYLGESLAVGLNLLRDSLPALLLATVLGFVALGVLSFFLVTRKDVALLYLSLICLSACFYIAGTSTPAGFLFQVALPMNAILRGSALLNVAGTLGFTRSVLDDRRIQLFRWPQYLLVVDAVLVVVAPIFGNPLPDLPNNLLFLFLAVLIIFTVSRSAIQGHIDAKIMCCGLIICWLMVIPDLLMLSGIWKHTSRALFIQCGLFIYILSMGLVLIRRFMETHRQLGRYSELLSEQIRALERRNTEIQTLNGELRRQIELRSDRMIELLSRSRSAIAFLPPAELFADQMLSEHYRVIRALGKGAMGSVYEIERTSDGLHLAAKLLTAKAERSVIIRFVREARLLAKLQHPNLVTIADIDISPDGHLFLVMELVEGTTLKDAKSRYADLDFVGSVLRQIALGLQAIHVQGIIHRDLKPANVLFSEANAVLQVKIADFGISTLGSSEGSASGALNTTTKRPPAPAGPQASAAAAALLEDDNDQEPATLDASPPLEIPILEQLDSASAPSSIDAAPAVTEPDELLAAGHLTQTGVVIGTPLYMAPELAHGSRKASPASDIFSFGVIAFEMLTGKMPFSVPPVVAVWNDHPLVIPRLGMLRKDLPQPVVSVLERCLDPDPMLLSAPVSKRCGAPQMNLDQR